jgi:hypothetical protein
MLQRLMPLRSADAPPIKLRGMANCAVVSTDGALLLTLLRKRE